MRSESSSTSFPAILVGERRGKLATVLEGKTEVIYKDVPVDGWFAPYVSLLLEEKIAQGYKDEKGRPTGEFGVANPVTRAELFKLALEAAGKVEVLPKLAPENRSARGTWAAPYVRLAEDLHLTILSSNPDVHQPATRGEVVQTVLEVMDFPIPKTPASFFDVPADHPYSPAIGLAAYSGFVEGDRGPDGALLNRFRPDDPIIRAEVAKLIALAREVLKEAP